MNVKNIEKKENNMVSVAVTVDAAEFETAVNRAYLNNKNKIFVPGFRKGKAPRKVIEGMYGKEVFHEEALDMVCQPAYEAAASDDSLELVGRPTISDVNFAEDGSVVITFDSALYPEVKLGQFRGLEAPKTVEPVTDEEINADLDRQRERNARMVTVDRAAENGDIAVIDYEGFKDGVPFEGGKDEKHELHLGSGTFIPGFEEQVVGMSAGEEKDVNVTFPAEYHAKELAGKPVVFKVKLHEVKVKELPELDDEFAKDVSENFETLEELKADTRKRLEEGRAAAAENLFREALMQKAIENMEVEIPEAMLAERVDQMMQEYSMNMQQYGMTLEQYTQMMGMDMASFRSTIEPQAKTRLQRDILCRAIFETGEIAVSDEEVEEEYKRLAEQYKIDVEKVREVYTAEDIKKELGLLKAADEVFNTGVVAAE
ncbi:MAG: trigger factor [Candidatus Heteroscillospira sp.]|jgi:trigger factor